MDDGFLCSYVSHGSGDWKTLECLHLGSNAKVLKVYQMHAFQ